MYRHDNCEMGGLQVLLRRKPGAYSNISQPSWKMPTLSFGGGSHLGVP